MTACPTPAQNLATLLRCITMSAGTQSIIGRLSNAIVGLLIARFQVIREAFDRLAARIEAGTYRPRRSGPRRPPAIRKPRQKSPLPQGRGWIRQLLPMLDANAYRGQLDHMLRDPEMQKLLEAAPAAMARILRPLCWALRLEPPEILARPRPMQPAAAVPIPAPAEAPRPARPTASSTPEHRARPAPPTRAAPNPT